MKKNSENCLIICPIINIPSFTLIRVFSVPQNTNMDLKKRFARTILVFSQYWKTKLYWFAKTFQLIPHYNYQLDSCQRILRQHFYFIEKASFKWITTNFLICFGILTGRICSKMQWLKVLCQCFAIFPVHMHSYRWKLSLKHSIKTFRFWNPRIFFSSEFCRDMKDKMCFYYWFSLQ